MGWRDEYKVHPAADWFPMLPEEEASKLREGILANRLTSPISFFFPVQILGNPSIEYVKANGVLADGRNRMEALERLGKELTPCAIETVYINDEIGQLAFIMGRNHNRRHLTKLERADISVKYGLESVRLEQAGEEPKPRQDGEVSGGRGNKNIVKAKALEINAALPKDQQVGTRTIERAMAKVEGKKPSKRRKRRTKVEITRDTFVEQTMPYLSGLAEAVKKMRDGRMDTLTEKEMAEAIEIMESIRAGLKALIDECRLASEKAA